MMRPTLSEVLKAFQRLHGAPKRREPQGAFAMILYENASYLVPDDVRSRVFEALAKRVGIAPEQILSAPSSVLKRVIAQGGMLVDQRARKLVRAAEIADALGEPLDAVVARSLPEARRVLKKMPGVGAPGADKIALFAGGHRVLPLDSNGLRVLVRLGFAKEHRDYAATYRAVQAGIEGELPRTRPALVAAHLLLRTHGRTICTQTKPRCEACPLSARCAP
jgi:endonuclease-3